MSVEINIHIGTSEAVDALVHRYITARKAELEEAERRVRAVEREIDYALTTLGESYTNGSRTGSLNDLTDKLYDLKGVTCNVEIHPGEKIGSAYAMRLCIMCGGRELAIPLTRDPTIDAPEVIEAVDNLRRDLAAAKDVVYSLRTQIEKDGGPVALRGEMLARLVEAQAPDLSATINNIVGGSRLLTQNS